MSAEDYNRCIVEVNQGDHISLALDKQVLGLLCLWGTHTYMTIIQLEQDNQCLRASNSSATIAFQVPRTNGPSHTPSSLFQPSQHLQHNQSNGQLRRINSQLPPPPPAVNWSGYQAQSTSFHPDLVTNHLGQEGMPPPPPVESARRLYDSWATTTQGPSGTFQYHTPSPGPKKPLELVARPQPSRR